MKITINLLSEERKNQIIFRWRCHIILKFALMAGLASIVYVLFVLACMQIIEMQRKSVAQEIAKITETRTYQKVKADQELIKDYNKMAAVIEKGLSDKDTFLPVFDKLNEIDTKQIEFEEIIVDADGVSMKGIGQERQAVIDLKNNLESTGMFSKVEAPISNFTQEKDVFFEFKMEYKERKK